MREAIAAQSDDRDSSISSRITTLVSRPRSAPELDPARSSAPTLHEVGAPPALGSAKYVWDGSDERISHVDDEPAEWCVDHGDGMTVMSLVELWVAISQGEVGPRVRVWREGMECWTTIDKMPELACALAPASDDPLADDHSDIEESQAVPRVSPVAAVDDPSDKWPATSALLIVLGVSLAAGMGVSSPAALEPIPTARDQAPPIEAQPAAEARRDAAVNVATTARPRPWRRMGSGAAGRERSSRAGSAD